MNHIEATRLVDWYDEDGFKEGTKAPHKWVLQAAEELRRLRDENAALRQAIEQAESDIRYTDIQLAEMILSDCGHSSEYTSLLHRVAARITQHAGQAIEQAEKQEPVAWHEPGAYGNVTTHKDWALANGWEPLYPEKT